MNIKFKSDLSISNSNRHAHVSICDFIGQHVKMNLLLVFLFQLSLIFIPSYSFSQIPRVSNPVCAYCYTPLPNGIHRDINKCPYYIKPNSTTKSSPVTSTTKSSLSVDMSMMAIQFLIYGLLNTDNSQQEKTDLEEKQKKLAEEQAEEQHKKVALEKWLNFQTEEETKRQMETNAKIKQGADMLSKMQTVGNGGSLEPFSMGNPKLDIQPISQTTYPTSKNEWERLLCSAYFSNLANKSTNDVDARFYADQAERVMLGEPTFLECRIPKVSEEKMAKKMEEVKILYSEMNVKFKDLQDIESKLQETRGTLKKAEIKKEEATKKVNELQNLAVTAKPEEKPKADDLVSQAMKQLQDADQEVNQLKQSESEYLNKKTETENELNKLNTQIQGKTQAGGE